MKKRNDGGLFLPGHDGRPKGTPNTPAMHGPAVASDAFKGHHVPGNIARDGAPKFHHNVPAHPGMVSRTRNGGPFVLGGDMVSKFDADPASPIGGAPRGKVPTEPQVVPGQRRRATDLLAGGAPGQNHATAKALQGADALSELGKRLLAEAFAASGEHPNRSGLKIDALPIATKENT